MTGAIAMETIGQAAILAVEALMDGEPSCDRSPIAKPIIRVPTTAEEARILKEWADSQRPTEAPVTQEQLAKQLTFMAATLPSKATDIDAAQKRFVVYQSILGGYSNAAIKFMARRSCETLNWFPTPYQCLAILKEFQALPEERDVAVSYCQRFWQKRMESFLASLAADDLTDAQIAEAPDQWKIIASEKGLLRRMDDGSFIVRRKMIESQEGEAK